MKRLVVLVAVAQLLTPTEAYHPPLPAPLFVAAGHFDPVERLTSALRRSVVREEAHEARTVIALNEVQPSEQAVVAKVKRVSA